MERIPMEEVFGRVDAIATALENDELIIFPTDTIYGIGGRADSETALTALRSLKERWGKPFSIIAPSKEWIAERFDLKGHASWLDKLPGPYTLVLEPKEPFSEQLSTTGAIGVRIPDHPIHELVSRLGFPLVATSVNRSGFDPLTSLDELDEKGYERFSTAAFAIDDGNKPGPASRVVVLTDTRPVFVRM